MFPVGALIGIALVASRAGQKGQPGRASVKLPGPGGMYLAWLVALLLFGAAFSAFSQDKLAIAAALALPAIVIGFPWWLTRHVLIPLGWWRAAGWLTLLSRVRWTADNRGGRATAAAWALLHQRKRSSKAEAWVERLAGGAVQPTVDFKTFRKEQPLRGGSVLALGLLAVVRNDLDAARRMIRTVGNMDSRVAPAVAKGLATEWLAVDALQRGDWQEVRRLASRPGPRTRLTRFLGFVGARLDEPTRFRLQVAMWWVIAPRRWQTWSLLKLAWHAREISEAEAPTEGPSEPLVRAVVLHVGGLKVSAELGATGLQELGEAWDHALDDPGTAARLLKRASDLHVIDPGDAVGRLAQAASTDLAGMVKDSGVQWERLSDSSETLDRASVSIREDLAGAIEQASERLHTRVKKKKALPVADEWSEFCALRARFEQAIAVGGEEMRRTLFSRVDGPVCGLAVWLFNERQQKPLGNAIFRWLLDQAEAAGDVEAIKLQRKNVGCGCGAAA